ncbi:MAG: TonB-dependent receptor [Verrucomicrobia bacterium]|nr:TonB-dependent receptor [Verrucomicrobiota bacterium]
MAPALALAGAAAGAPAGAAAQEAEVDIEPPVLPPGTPNIEDLMSTLVPMVTGPSRFEQPTTEAPSSVTVLTADDIRKFGHRTLADALRTVPGLHVSYDRNYSFLGVRSFNRSDINSLNGRVLMLVNGHRINDNLSGGSDVGTAFFLDADLIERVEVVRGPGSVLYGNNAFFGVINVVTRQGGEVRGPELSGEYARFDTFKGRVTYGYRCARDVELLLSGTLYDSEGPDHGSVHGLDDDRFGSCFGSVRFRGLTLEGGYLEREKGNPTGQFDAMANDPDLRTVDERGYAALKWAHSFTNVLDVEGRLHYDRKDLVITVPQFVPPQGRTVHRLVGVGEWWGTEWLLKTTLADRHTLTLGAEYRDDFRQRLERPLGPLKGGNRDTWGVFLQGDLVPLSKVRLNAGLRYDAYSHYDPTLNPRVALLYDPWIGTTFKAIYGTAYRTPSFLEENVAFPNPLVPETIATCELIWEQRLGRHLRSSLAGFFNRMDDLITFDRNVDTAEARGIEMGLEGLWTGGWHGRLSYTLQEVEDRATNDPLPDAPNHLVKASLSLPLCRNKIFAGLDYQFTSTRRTVRGASLRGADAESYSILNLTVFSRELVKGLEVSASLYNLLDTRYDDPATPQHNEEIIGQDGFSFRIKAQYRF